MRLALDVFGRPEFRRGKLRPRAGGGYFLPPRSEQGLRLTLDILERQNLAWVNHDCVRPRRARAAGACRPSARGPERMGLTLDILEGQNFARKNHHGVGPTSRRLDILEGQNLARKNHHGVGPRRARSIFWKAKTSPGKINHGVRPRRAGASEHAIGMSGRLGRGAMFCLPSGSGEDFRR